jgi:gluconate 2-dehydrogenase gamma chain
LSRREWLKRAGCASAAATVVPLSALVRRRPTGLPPIAQTQTLETLTVKEAETLGAMVARLIPSEETGPGATEAHAATYIDRALADALAASRDASRSGLASVDTYARATKGAPFAQLSHADQDAVLSDMEQGVATGFSAGSAVFFTLVRTHTIQGTFGDPYYGGNANLVGWDLIGYPGIRLAVSADDQRLTPKPAPTHRSAYDHDMFSKPARTPVNGGRSDGD